ncbi:hypothetical protein Hanom_Chr08g00743591 [Helianthus anomalus]
MKSRFHNTSFSRSLMCTCFCNNPIAAAAAAGDVRRWTSFLSILLLLSTVVLCIVQ